MLPAENKIWPITVSSAGMALRTVDWRFTIVAAAWMIAQTHWYVTISLVLATCASAGCCARPVFATHNQAGGKGGGVRQGRISRRHILRWTRRKVFFGELLGDSAPQRTRAADGPRVLNAASRWSDQNAEESRPAIFRHSSPMYQWALISADERGGVQITQPWRRGDCLNRAFRKQHSSRGTVEAFAVGMESHPPGNRRRILRNERPTGTLPLKVAVTELALGGPAIASSRWQISRAK